MKKLILSLVFILIIFSANASAESLSVAVASNFLPTLRQLADDFTARTGHVLRISSASTGKIYAQIKHDAPFDVFMSADEVRPELLIRNGLAVESSATIYAIGRLVLVSNIKSDSSCLDVLQSKELKHLAIANPATAPYGMAAKRVLEHYERWELLQDKLVLGENIAQAYQFVFTRNAEAGLIAYSMLKQGKESNFVCIWPVPEDLHQPIRQKMVVLKKYQEKPAVISFQRYMKSSAATSIIVKSGYDVQR